jgi:hypothetical protein
MTAPIVIQSKLLACAFHPAFALITLTPEMTTTRAKMSAASITRKLINTSVAMEIPQTRRFKQQMGRLANQSRKLRPHPIKNKINMAIKTP